MEGTIYPRLVLLVYVLCFLCFSMCVELVPVVKCPEYVDEDSDLLGCECVAPLMEDGIQISWPEYSNTSQLTLKAVSRKANGTVFVCQMARMGVVTNTTYTLQVAFGPSDATMSITGPARFVTDGHRPLTLACEAHEVNPKPIITWQFGPCNHGVERDTCTFTPEISYHGRNITCRAINSVPKDIISATTNYTLRLEYPPIKPPEITGHKEGEIRKPGDSLKCTVSGGKPQVASVNFTCSNPPMADQPDEHLKNAISSALVLQAPTQSNFETVCTCSALWGPEPGLYPHVVKVSFAVQLQSHVSTISPVTTAPTDGSTDEGTSNSNTNAWMVVALLLIAVIVIVIFIVGGVFFVLWKRNWVCFPCWTELCDKIRNRQDESRLSRQTPVLSRSLGPVPGIDTNESSVNCPTQVTEYGNASVDADPNAGQEENDISEEDDRSPDTSNQLADVHHEGIPLLHQGSNQLQHVQFEQSGGVLFRKPVEVESQNENKDRPLASSVMLADPSQLSGDPQDEAENLKTDSTDQHDLSVHDTAPQTPDETSTDMPAGGSFFPAGSDGQLLDSNDGTADGKTAAEAKGNATDLAEEVPTSGQRMMSDETECKAEHSKRNLDNDDIETFSSPPSRGLVRNPKGD